MQHGSMEPDGEQDVVDLEAMRSDDALLDALGDSDPKVADELGDAELNAVLLSWSREVDSEAMPELVDVDTARTVITRANESYRKSVSERRMRMFVPVAAAAAVLAVAFGGTTVAARDAQPGDALWGLTKVFYADKAGSVEASYTVQADFKRARDALNRGEYSDAKDALKKAEISLHQVRKEEGHDGLRKQHDVLVTQLDSGTATGSHAKKHSSTKSTHEHTSKSTSTSEPGSSSSERTTEPTTTTSPTTSSDHTSESTAPTTDSPTSTTTSTPSGRNGGVGANNFDGDAGPASPGETTP